jgi:hypothetical protein
MRRCHISPVNLSQIVTKSLILQVIDTALPGVQNRYDRSNGSSAIESPGGVEPPRPVYFCFSIVDDFLFVLYRSSRGWDAPSRCTSLAGTILGRLFYGIVVFRYLGTKGDRPVRLDVFTTSLALSQLHDPTKTHRPIFAFVSGKDGVRESRARFGNADLRVTAETIANDKRHVDGNCQIAHLAPIGRDR